MTTRSRRETPPATPLTAAEWNPAAESGAGANTWLYSSIPQLIKKGMIKRQLVALEASTEFHRIHNTIDLLR